MDHADARAGMTRTFFEQTVELALEELRSRPGPAAAEIDNLTVVVEARADPDQDSCGKCLLGMYEGVSLPERGADYIWALPDRISIYMDAHLALGLDREATAEEIRRTVLHEIAHYLGIEEARLHELGWG